MTESTYERAQRLVSAVRNADMRRSESRRLADEIACAIANTTDRQATAWLDSYLLAMDERAERRAGR